MFLSPRLLLRLPFSPEDLSYRIVPVTRLILIESSILSGMTRMTSGSTLIVWYGPNQRGRSSN